MAKEYYNPTTRQHGEIDKLFVNGRPLFSVKFQDESGADVTQFYDTEPGALTAMRKRGYYAISAYAQNPTYKIGHYSITVKNEGRKPGETVEVLIHSDRVSAKYVYLYNVTWFLGDNTLDIANLALFHYKLWANRSVRKLPIQKD